MSDRLFFLPKMSIMVSMDSKSTGMAWFISNLEIPSSWIRLPNWSTSFSSSTRKWLWICSGWQVFNGTVAWLASMWAVQRGPYRGTQYGPSDSRVFATKQRRRDWIISLLFILVWSMRSSKLICSSSVVLSFVRTFLRWVNKMIFQTSSWAPP